MWAKLVVSNVCYKTDKMQVTQMYIKGVTGDLQVRIVSSHSK